MKISKILGKSFYVTTPIFYVNSVPHLGHLYTAVLADAQTRWRKVKREQVFFLTGTDEHGYKVQKKAKLEQKECKPYCDSISAKFRDLFNLCDIDYNDFIRTTETRHHQAVNHFWTHLFNKGFIYKSTYTGWYSVNDECFLNDDQIESKQDSNGNEIKCSIESGHPVELTSETNYMFKLREFKSKLRSYLEKNIIIPQKYQQALHAQIDTLEDLSVSRERQRIYWGIPVPNDPSQIVYVWLDALVNYLTAAGYPNDTDKFSKLWPADVHVVGKDILRFHAIYWPAFLLAADLELPKRILCHGHWLVDNKKMSKSIGNVIDPFDCVNKYTKDGLRYFLLREGVPDSDCNINKEKFTKFVNAELANTLGNLYQRCLPFNPDLVYPTYAEIESVLNEQDKELIKKLNEIRFVCDKEFEVFNYYNGLNQIMSGLRLVNNMVQEYKPWLLVKSNKHDLNLKKLLFFVYESLRISGILLQSITPSLASDLLDRLNVNANERFYENANVYCTLNQQRANPNGFIKQNSNILFKRLN